MQAELVEQDHRQQIGPADPRGMRWKGAGGCAMVSRVLQINFSRSV
jgi:hypothetical protein